MINSVQRLSNKGLTPTHLQVEAAHLVGSQAFLQEVSVHPLAVEALLLGATSSTRYSAHSVDNQGVAIQTCVAQIFNLR